MSDALSRIVDYIAMLGDEYSRETFSNLLGEFLYRILPGHSPENEKVTEVKDFVARFTNATISGTDHRRMVYGLRILDAMISILRSPTIGPVHFENSSVERLSPLEEQLRWELVENATSRFRDYWEGRFGRKRRNRHNLASQLPQTLFQYICGLANRGFLRQEPFTRILLLFMHNFQNRVDLKHGACLVHTFTSPVLFREDADVLYELLEILRYRCRDLFGMNTIVEERQISEQIYKAIYRLGYDTPTLFLGIDQEEIMSGHATSRDVDANEFRRKLFV
ncbi:hypothetical protein M413DRAFT_428335 [Hebeloma cylindrosporum]|uniref:Uncharacterized protein n=1 Tax=Hebeloma cylindrosporum TaxID=76867 RepID=A0A0C3BGH7_HEBCY|nr:hypothetical protein M413DRAFT_428335 [Hebeloma cylindrosporum h7]